MTVSDLILSALYPSFEVFKKGASGCTGAEMGNILQLEYTVYLWHPEFDALRAAGKADLEDLPIVDSTAELEYEFYTVLGQEAKFAGLKGLTRGLEGVCKGERRLIKIPPDFAFGDERFKTFPGFAGVPKGAVLLMDATVVANHGSGGPPPGAVTDWFAEIDADDDLFLSKAELKRHFASRRLKPYRVAPPRLTRAERTRLLREEMKSDSNGDGRLSWAEYRGPKGRVDPSSAREGTL